MRKIFLASIALTIFSISILLFQISCQKPVDAQTLAPLPGTLILYNRTAIGGPDEIWRSNIDGSNQQKINIVLPAGLKLELSDGGEIKVTPDNQKIVFKVRGADQDFYYSCSIDGSNLTKIIDGPVGGRMELGCVN